MVLNIIISVVLVALAAWLILPPMDKQDSRRQDQRICFGVLALLIPYIVFAIGGSA